MFSLRLRLWTISGKWYKQIHETFRHSYIFLCSSWKIRIAVENVDYFEHWQRWRRMGNGSKVRSRPSKSSEWSIFPLYTNSSSHSTHHLVSQVLLSLESMWDVFLIFLDFLHRKNFLPRIRAWKSKENLSFLKISRNGSRNRDSTSLRSLKRSCKTNITTQMSTISSTW